MDICPKVSMEMYNIYDIKARVPKTSSMDLLMESLSESIKQLRYKKEKICVLFSGGIDSTLLAKLIKDNFEDVMLITAGVKDCKDYLPSKTVSEYFKIPWTFVEINKDNIQSLFMQTVTTLNEYNKMQIELGIPVLAAALKAKELGYHTVVSANGADELFCGYNYYRRELENGYAAVRERTWRDLEEEEERNYKREFAIISSLGMDIEYPYLFENFMLQALAFPPERNILSVDDKIRKHILRKLAIEMGIPEEFAMRPKKAMQYGSGINKFLKNAPVIQEPAPDNQHTPNYL